MTISLKGASAGGHLWKTASWWWSMREEKRIPLKSRSSLLFFVCKWAGYSARAGYKDCDPGSLGIFFLILETNVLLHVEVMKIKWNKRKLKNILNIYIYIKHCYWCCRREGGKEEETGGEGEVRRERKGKESLSGILTERKRNVWTFSKQLKGYAFFNNSVQLNFQIL